MLEGHTYRVVSWGGAAVMAVVLCPAALYIEDRFLIAVIWRGLETTFMAQIVLGSQQEYLESVVSHSNKVLCDIYLIYPCRSTRSVVSLLQMGEWKD